MKYNTLFYSNRYGFCFVLVVFLLLITGSYSKGHAQIFAHDAYELRAAPDLWYNSVDGMLAGVRLRGEDPRTFLDGPHRVNASIRLATKFPELPVSYYVSYTQPIAAISGINSEGALQLVSSIRTGLHLHEVGVRKRIQPGFDEYITTEFRIFGGFYQRFDSDYLLYDYLWQDAPTFYLRSFLRKRDRNPLGRWTFALTGLAGVPDFNARSFNDFSGRESDRPEFLGKDGLFGQIHFEAMQHVALPAGFFTRTRLFSGVSTYSLPPEHRYLSSDAAAFDWMNSEFTRARGTIPPAWMSAGWVHIPGGPGLRGYTIRTTELLEDGIASWVQHAVSVNMDFHYPNPVNNWFSRIPYLGDLLRLESYIFADAGLLKEQSEWQDLKMDAGAGFMLSLNIPDYLGQDRGFFLRYELPVWLSEVEREKKNIELRHLLGLGLLYRM